MIHALLFVADLRRAPGLIAVGNDFILDIERILPPPAVRGRAGYGKALEDIRRRNPGLRGIWDVKLDDHTLSVLGFFRRVCTEVTARGFR